MIGSFQRMLRTPFARPPGRRSALARFAPEVCALAVTAIALLLYHMSGKVTPLLDLAQLCGLSPDSGTWLPKTAETFARARAVIPLACGLAAMMLVFLPTGKIAANMAGERQQGTLEAMLLTPTHHRLLIRGRYWFLASPWLRFALYITPLYLALGLMTPLDPEKHLLPGFYGSAYHPHVFSYGAAPWSIRWLDLLGRAFITHSWKAAFSVWRLETIPAGSGHGFVLSGLRWANDASSFAFAAAAAYFISIRAASVRRAVLVSFLAVVAALLTVLSPDAWWLLFSQLSPSRDPSAYLRSYWIIAMLLVAARLVLAFKLVGRVADNFDAYALGEEPDKERPATPRLRRRRSV